MCTDNSRNIYIKLTVLTYTLYKTRVCSQKGVDVLYSIMYHTRQQMLLSSTMNWNELWRGSGTLSGGCSHSQAMSTASYVSSHQWKYLRLTLIFSYQRKLNWQEKTQTDIELMWSNHGLCQIWFLLHNLAVRPFQIIICVDFVVLSKQTVNWIQVDVLVILLSFTRQLEVCTSNHHSICRARHAWTNYW